MKRCIRLGLFVAASAAGLVACSDDESRTPSLDGGTINGGSDALMDVAAMDQRPGDTSGDGSLALDAGVDATPADAGVDAPPCNVAPTAEATARLRVTCDDFVKIYFNGVLVDAPTSLWSTLKEYDVKVYLYPQKRNVIAFECKNAYEQGGLDRGAIAELVYTAANQTKYVKTDSTWRASATAPANWIDLNFDDKQWAAATSLGASGIPPWSQVFPDSGAEWLWTYIPNAAPADKPDDETNYFRKVFFMDTQGVASDVAPACQ
ncbi:MAG: hypothetical protein SF187_25135 [Deltaproteobacteria bacterium]|nr:hypothetical protein [Deltaproteobacteria bacterium]